VQEIKFHHYPIALSMKNYQDAFAGSVSYLKKTFPESSIFKVGGESIRLGISDLDFLILSHNPINGNKLYLRNFPKLCLRNGLLLHEAFGVDAQTYAWLNRLTSFKLDLVYGNKDKLHPEILETDSIFNYFKLSYYLVVNYPMVFLEWKGKNEIHVRRTLTKLKKLFNLEALIQTCMGPTSRIMSDDFRSELTLLINEHNQYSPSMIQKKILYLLNEALEVIREAFSVFEELAHELGYATNIETSARIRGKQLEFSNRWKKCLQTRDIYHLPVSLGGFNQIFSHINSKFLSNISYSSSPVEIPAFEEISRVINQYLNYCEKSHILQLIFDIDFSVAGHNSRQYRFYQAMSRLKQIF